MGSKYRLLPRWNSFSENKKIIVEKLQEIVPDIPKNKRGQPPKHPIKNYLILIILKEIKRSPLRGAETDWSEYVCGERVDHSVIHYWEQRIPPEIIEETIRKAGNKLEDILGYEFSVIDATSFSDWRKENNSFHLINRVCECTVYPVGIARDTLDPIQNTRNAMVPGQGFFMGDKWYDVNGVFRMVFGNGYTPLISPQRMRGRGYWRRKARKIYDIHWMRYRQRGRGESVFGSLTVWFGDRLHTRKQRTTYLRICARVLGYQVRILIRAGCGCLDNLLVILVNS